MLCAITNRQMGARSGHVRRAHGPAPRLDPFAAADLENQAQANAHELAAHERQRAARRDHQPPAEGGLFDECRRGEQDLWS